MAPKKKQVPVGAVFGIFTIIKEIFLKTKHNGRMVVVRCNFGIFHVRRLALALANTSFYCGLCRVIQAEEKKKKLLEAIMVRKYGNWTPVTPKYDRYGRPTFYIDFKCDCGALRVMHVTNVRNPRPRLFPVCFVCKKNAYSRKRKSRVSPTSTRPYFNAHETPEEKAVRYVNEHRNEEDEPREKDVRSEDC